MIFVGSNNISDGVLAITVDFYKFTSNIGSDDNLVLREEIVLVAGTNLHTRSDWVAWFKVFQTSPVP